MSFTCCMALVRYLRIPLITIPAARRDASYAKPLRRIIVMSRADVLHIDCSPA